LSELVDVNSLFNCLTVLVFLRYLVFYTPFDIGYSIAKFLPVKLVFSVMKEIYRYVLTSAFMFMLLYSCKKSVIFSCKKVHDGVLHAAKLYPNAYIIMVLIGTLKGIKIHAYSHLIILLNSITYHLLIPGNGASFTKIIERLLRGVWTPTSIETLQPSLYVK